MLGDTSNLMDRIIGAFTFRQGIYAEVEHDQSFTNTAWVLVVAVSILRGLGTAGFGEGFLGWLIGAVVIALFSVGGFALAAFLVSWVGKTMFNADTHFEEMVRVLGLAFVWNVVGVLGILGGFISCLLAPITLAAAVAGLVAWAFAAKEALDLEWGQTIIVILVGWVAAFVITFIGSSILAIIGLGGAAAAGAFGS